MAFDSTKYAALTFDCYGTLIDWAHGITSVLQPILRSHGIEVNDDRLFEQYLRFEADVEKGEYLPYRDVLRRVVRRFGTRHDFRPTNAEIERLPDSVGDWPPFPDTNEALRRLGSSFRLAIVSNVDDDLLFETRRHFDVEFDEIVTGEQVGTYKPDLAPFEAAFSRLGVAPTQVLHVAQSGYHDIDPASRLGLSSVWVQRYGERYTSQTPRSEPTLIVPDLATLADTILQD